MPAEKIPVVIERDCRKDNRGDKKSMQKLQKKCSCVKFCKINLALFMSDQQNSLRQFLFGPLNDSLVPTWLSIFTIHLLQQVLCPSGKKMLLLLHRLQFRV